MERSGLQICFSEVASFSGQYDRKGLTSAPDSYATVCIKHDRQDIPKSGLQRIAAEIGAATEPQDKVPQLLIGIVANLFGKQSRKRNSLC